MNTSVMSKVAAVVVVLLLQPRALRQALQRALSCWGC
jgi:hypothetical protein